MKQGKPLKRVPMPPRKEWMKGSSLRSYKPSTEGEEKQPKPRRSTGKSAGVNEARKLVKQRSGGLCEIRMVGCFGEGTDWHHRKLRSQGGPWHVQNGLQACRFCHGRVTNTNGHSKEYEECGWLVRRGTDFASTEVLMWHNGRQDWVLLKEDGSVELAEFPSGDPRHPDDIEVPQESEIGGAA